MLYTTINIGGKDYKARLNAKACVELEKKLGENPLNVFTAFTADNRVPELGTMITILHASLQAYEHGITLDKTYELYDEFVNEGNTMLELFPIILEIFEVSGFFRKEEDNLKNG